MFLFLRRVVFLFVPVMVISFIWRAWPVDVPEAAPSPKKAVAAVPRVFKVKASAYIVDAGWTDTDPWITSSGDSSRPGVTIGVTPDILKYFPPGSAVKIVRPKNQNNGCNLAAIFGSDSVLYGVRSDLMGDSANGLPVDRTIDIMIADRRQALAFGKCQDLSISIVEELLLRPAPKTKEELFSIVQQNQLVREGRSLAKM